MAVQARGQLKYKSARLRVMVETGHLVYRVKNTVLIEIAAILVSRKTSIRP